MLLSVVASPPRFPTARKIGSACSKVASAFCISPSAEYTMPMMGVDFRLPKDIKKDARTTDGTTFIGLNAVHSKNGYAP